MKEKPNIIIIMTDQQQAGACAREGFPLDTTPFLDSLARKGAWFDHAYTAAPVCAPARVSMLTGRFPSSHRVVVNHGIHNVKYSMDMMDFMKKMGYLTAMVGKNHSHLGPKKLDHWFELSHAGRWGISEEGMTPDSIKKWCEFNGRPDKLEAGEKQEEVAFDIWINDLKHGVAMEPAPFPLECQGPCRAVTDAEVWISQHKDNPFFMWLSFAEPHSPYQVPEPYFGMFDPESLPPVKADKSVLEYKGYKWRFTKQLGEYVYPDYDRLIPRARANYYGMLRLIDDQVRRLVGYLEKENILENTLIVFVSDHGDFAGEYGLMRKGPEVPEILMRVPMFFVGPGIKPDCTPKSEFVSIVDIFPTLCEVLGQPIPHGVQGRSIWPVLTGGSYPAEEFESIYAEQGYGGLHYSEDDDIKFDHCVFPEPFGPTFDCLNSYSQSGTLRMLRKGNWKLVVDMQGKGQLYNLEKDSLELQNLFEDDAYAGIKCELLRSLLAWAIRTQDPLAFPEKGRYIMKKDRRNYYTCP